MAKRLTEKQKEEILNGFLSGKTIEELSKDFYCTKLTVSRNLKRSIGEKKYKETIRQNKTEKKINFTDSAEEVDSKLFSNSQNKNISNNKKSTHVNDQIDNFGLTQFLELTPLDCEIENSPRKEFSSVPLSEIDLPKIVYMIVDKQIELVVKLLKDFPEWSFLPVDDLNRKTIEIFFDLRNAKRSCDRDQKVIKIPNSDVFRIVSPILNARGISRIVSAEKLIAI